MAPHLSRMIEVLTQARRVYEGHAVTLYQALDAAGGMAHSDGGARFLVEKGLNRALEIEWGLPPLHDRFHDLEDWERGDGENDPPNRARILQAIDDAIGIARAGIVASEKEAA